MSTSPHTLVILCFVLSLSKKKILDMMKKHDLFFLCECAMYPQTQCGLCKKNYAIFECLKLDEN